MARSNIVPVGLCGCVTLMSRVSPVRTRCGHLLDVEPPAVLEAEVDHVEVGADRPRRLEVRGVVGAHDDGVVARLEQRRGHAEQRGGGAGGDEHVVGREPVAAGGHRLPQQRVAEVVAVAEQQLVEVERRARGRASRRSATELSERLLVIVS